MAYVGSTNNTLTAASVPQDTAYAMKTALTAAGWTVMGSSNGSSFNNPGVGAIDYVPNYAAWNTAGSWVRLREPSGAGGREYVIMRGSGTGLIIKYSRSVGFSTGGGATTLPTTGASGDGVVWWGSTIGFSATGTGTNTYDLATTTTAQQQVVSIGSGYVSCVASTTAVNGVYGFWLIGYANGSAALQYLVYSEGIDATSCSPLDNDPSIRQFTGANWWANDLATGNRPQYWQGYPSPWVSPTTATYRQESAGFNYWVYTNTSMTPVANTWPAPSTTQSLSPYNNKYVSYPFLISAANVVGSLPKGMTSGVRMTFGVLNPLDTLDLTTADPRIIFGQGGPISGSVSASIPWVPNVLPLV